MQYIQNLQVMMVLVNLIYFASCVVWYSDQLTSTSFLFSSLLLLAFHAGAYNLIILQGRPTYDTRGSLIDGGGDLSAG